jgi:PAS domain S-box-containing protein
MKTELRVLIVEDNEDDTLLLLRILLKEGYDVKYKRVEIPSEMERTLNEEQWDVIISDYSLPKFRGTEALEIFKSKNLDIPFILVSGTVGEDIAVDMMKAGAHDYVTKLNIKRIIPAIQRELKEVGVRKQRRFALESLKKREEQYGYLINNMNEGLLQVDNEDRIQFVNKRISEMFDYEDKELIGQKCYDILVHPDDSPIVFNANTERMKGESTKYELRMLKKEGGIIWAEISGSPLFDDEGKVVGSIGLVTDITQRRMAENAVKESEEKFRGLVERISDLVVILEHGSIITFTTPSVKNILGYDQYEIIGKNAIDYFLSEEKLIIENYIQRILSGETIDRVIVPVPKKDGSIAILECTATPIYNEKKISGIQMVGRDITERRLAEENIRKLSRAVDQSPVSIFITDTKGIFDYVNPRFSEVTGYRKVDVIGKNVNILKSGNLENELYSSLWDAISAGKEWSGEFLNKNKNGELIWVSSAISPIKNDTGEITHYISMMEDITNRKEMEFAIKQAMETAEESSRLKSSILANVSHELRTPMTAILGIAQLLIEEVQDEYVNELIRKIKKSSDRLMTTLNSILNLSEIESNSSLLYLNEYKIGRQIKMLLCNYENYAAERNLYFKYSIPDKDVTALVDERFMNQIIINLVDNAVKYTDTGGIEISINPLKRNGNYIIELKVKDTGIGISAENKEVIFHEFRQVSEGIDRRYEGAGLGLTLAKKMIELMNGAIYVESEVGKGSTFIVTVPGVESAEKQNLLEEVNENITEKKREKIKRFEGGILLVEDSKDNADVIIKFLNVVGVVDYAKGGWEALKMVKEKNYSLILMDINLGPGLDGVNTLKKIRELPEYLNIPIIALTGYAMSADKEKFLSIGFDYYISKPVSKPQLISEVSQVLKEFYPEKYMTDSN